MIETKALLDPSHTNFQAATYLKNLHKHTSWEDLKRYDIIIK